MQLRLQKNDKKARWIIFSFSIFIFIAVTILERVTIPVDLGFDVHIFSAANAVINTIVALLLIAGLITARRRQLITHRNIMLTAIMLSVVFLFSYIIHHLFAGSTWYGDINKDGVVSDAEKAEAGMLRYVYFVLLGTHILLAGVSLPYILFSAYRALTGEYSKHRKLGKITWPIWFYVAVSGPLVYLMISRYY